MEAFAGYMDEYHRELQKGAIQKAYRGLMQYILDLRTHFQNRHPDLAPGGLYYGYMDMTYFALMPESLKERRLKIAVVFLHEAFRFEAWLAGFNKQVQSQYWKLFTESGWDKYHIVAPAKGVDSIVECVLVDNPDFGHLGALTARIERGTLRFIEDIESFVGK